MRRGWRRRRSEAVRVKRGEIVVSVARARHAHALNRLGEASLAHAVVDASHHISLGATAFEVARVLRPFGADRTQRDAAPLTNCEFS
jgi:hypothetical protein